MEILEHSKDFLKNLLDNFLKNYSNFIHLHVHTEGSFLDGACAVDDLVKKCAESNMPVVVTDHGNVAVTVRVLNAISKYNKKRKEKGQEPVDIPFVRGIEIYLEKDDTKDDEFASYEGKYNHLILLPYNKKGFENINYISSQGYIEGLINVFGRDIPVVKRKFLKDYSEGIVCLSACMFGELSAFIWTNYPYLKVLKRIDEKAYHKFIRVSKIAISKKILTRKNSKKVDELSVDDIQNMVLQRRKLKKLKNILLKKIDTVDNSKLIQIAAEDESYIDKLVTKINYYTNIYKYFYLEVQDHGFVEQRLTTLLYKYVNEKFNLGLKLVITNDVHYLKPEDWEKQDVLICIGLKTTLADKGRFKFDKHELYFKSKEELMKEFQYISSEEREEYLNNTAEVAAICCQYNVTLESKLYPKYPIPEGFKNADEYILYLEVQGAKDRIKNMGKKKKYRYNIFSIVEYKDLLEAIEKYIPFETAIEYVKDKEKQRLILKLIEPGIKSAAKEVMEKSLTKHNKKFSPKTYSMYIEVLERVVYEYSVIRIKSISDYFLIVRHIITAAHEHNIYTGPGRGSAAGAVTSYLLNITNLDPIQYNLIFERFINPERNSYPDIDSDFEQRGLPIVRELTAQFFGIDKCCGIQAFGCIQDKKAIQDSFKCYGFASQETNKISKDIRQIIKGSLNILENIKSDKILAERYEVEPLFKKAVDMACRITGQIRQPGTHAAGMVIVPKSVELMKKMPLMDSTKKPRLKTQYDKGDVEQAGFLKMDLLGLRTLDVIHDTFDMVKEFRGIILDMSTIPLDDKKALELYQKAETDFIFQVESGGMKKLVKELNPQNIEDIIALIAGYRPGPMAHLPKFIAARNGAKIVYRHPKLKPILEVTGGIPFYQEQVMDIFKELAGYSLGAADLVRRAMGHKEEEVMNAEKYNFIHGVVDENGAVKVPGCIRNGIPEEVAAAIFEDIRPFCEYGFNKSHAAAYGVVSWITAYLKANFFLEFATAVLKSFEENTKKLARYAFIIKQNGVKILFPDINISKKHISIYDFENNIISTGLLSIKDLGANVIDDIIKERETNGTFKSFNEFLKRMIPKGINKKAVEALIYSGAFDNMDKNYKKLIDIYESKGSYYKSLDSLENSNQITFYEIPEFRDKFEDLMDEVDDRGYNIQDKLMHFCDFNLIGIPNSISEVYENNINLQPLGYKKSNASDDIEEKTGVVTGVLMDEFTPSKAGKAFLTDLMLFDGEVFRIILSKKNMYKIYDGDIKNLKKGMVIELKGNFQIPVEINENNTEEISEDDDENKDDSEKNSVVFPWDITIKEAKNPLMLPEVLIEVPDEESKERLSILNKKLSKKSPYGKVIKIKFKNKTYVYNSRVDIPLNDIKSLGYDYTVSLKRKIN